MMGVNADHLSTGTLNSPWSSDLLSAPHHSASLEPKSVFNLQSLGTSCGSDVFSASHSSEGFSALNDLISQIIDDDPKTYSHGLKSDAEVRSRASSDTMSLDSSPGSGSALPTWSSASESSHPISMTNNRPGDRSSVSYGSLEDSPSAAAKANPAWQQALLEHAQAEKRGGGRKKNYNGFDRTFDQDPRNASNYRNNATFQYGNHHPSMDKTYQEHQRAPHEGKRITKSVYPPPDPTPKYENNNNVGTLGDLLHQGSSPYPGEADGLGWSNTDMSHMMNAGMTLGDLLKFGGAENTAGAGETRRGLPAPPVVSAAPTPISKPLDSNPLFSLNQSVRGGGYPATRHSPLPDPHRSVKTPDPIAAAIQRERTQALAKVTQAEVQAALASKAALQHRQQQQNLPAQLQAKVAAVLNAKAQQEQHLAQVLQARQALLQKEYNVVVSSASPITRATSIDQLRKLPTPLQPGFLSPGLDVGVRLPTAGQIPMIPASLQQQIHQARLEEMLLASHFQHAQVPAGMLPHHLDAAVNLENMELLRLAHSRRLASSGLMLDQLPLPLTPALYAQLPRQNRRSGPGGELHTRLEACCDQCHSIERERKKAEADLARAFPGRNVAATSADPLPRLPHNPSRVDRLIVNSFREHNKVTVLVEHMASVQGREAVPGGVQATLDGWVEAVRKVQVRRRQELTNAAARQHHNRLVPRPPAPPHDNTDVLALATAIKDLDKACRHARTALWAMLQMTLPIPNEQTGEDTPTKAEEKTAEE